MDIKKRILIFLLCAIFVIFFVALALWGYQKAEGEPMEYVKRHKEEWINLLENNSEVRPYLEQLYTIEDELTINYRNGELTISESASNIFNSKELEKLEEFFIMFQWETIRLNEQENTKRKVLEAISSQMKFGKFFSKHFCTAVIVYSPNGKLDGGEEIFPDWYYIMYFET